MTVYIYCAWQVAIIVSPSIANLITRLAIY